LYFPQEFVILKKACIICGPAGRGRFFLSFRFALLGGAFFSRERKEAKGRLRNYVP
jgi:hypothetical protein